MRWFVILLLSLSTGWAQLTVQLRLPKDTFLVYEAIPVTVSIRNYSGRTIQLDNTGTASWLNFQLTGENNQLIPATGQVVGGEAVLIPPGQTIARVIDLLPLFELRARGSYRIKALVKAGATTTPSPGLDLALINGRELWTQTVGLPPVEGVTDEYRVYSLVSRREKDKDLLYIGMRAEPSQTVYSLVPLGLSLSTSEPQATIDNVANLHVLYQNGPRSYGYVSLEPTGKIAQRAAYSDYLSAPILQNRAGVVTVTGGEQTYPRPERILTDDELNPPPPPPKPKPKKKWWWPFGKKHVPGEGY